MSQKVVMRTGADRVRYTISFELLLMAMLIPAGAAFFDKPLLSIGTLSAILAVKAMIINLIYNWAFDKVDALFIPGPTGTNVNDFRAILITG